MGGTIENSHDWAGVYFQWRFPCRRHIWSSLILAKKATTARRASEVNNLKIYCYMIAIRELRQGLRRRQTKTSFENVSSRLFKLLDYSISFGLKTVHWRSWNEIGMSALKMKEINFDLTSRARVVHTNLRDIFSSFCHAECSSRPLA